VSYVDRNLLTGERVVYRARLHRLMYALPVLLLGASLALALFGADIGYGWAIGGAIAGLLTLLVVHIAWLSSEFAVTNMRVIAKTGWIERTTVETLLSKIEAIGVDQQLMGRVLGFGTVQITGTGGTRESFRKIARPLELRRQIQAQIVAADERRLTAAEAARSGGAEPRQERECPWCAERILVKAKICKHCGRDVA
jgi:uncharacterized membrane protein YdbT with pleckstrin-like domain